MTPQITIDAEGLARLDGLLMFRVIVRDAVIILEFKDHDRMRSQCRGSRLVEIPLNDIITALTLLKEKADER